MIGVCQVLSRTGNRDSLRFQFQDFREYGYDGANRLQKIKEHRFDLATLIRTGALRPVDTPILHPNPLTPPIASYSRLNRLV